VDEHPFMTGYADDRAGYIHGLSRVGSHAPHSSDRVRQCKRGELVARLSEPVVGRCRVVGPLSTVAAGETAIRFHSGNPRGSGRAFPFTCNNRWASQLLVRYRVAGGD
jgi:hypothetical protein